MLRNGEIAQKASNESKSAVENPWARQTLVGKELEPKEEQQ
jgi:hypothetical protein